MAYIPTSNAIQKLRKTKSGAIATDDKTILNTIVEYFGISQSIILTKTRKREVVYPRQLAMYFMAYYTLLSLKQIGEMFGKDHTTVIHSIDAIEGWASNDEKVREQIHQITQKILPYGFTGEEDIRGGA